MMREDQRRHLPTEIIVCPGAGANADRSATRATGGLRAPRRRTSESDAQRRIMLLEEANTQLRRQLVELRRESARVRHLACHDDLTGLPNRRLLMDRLNQAMARAVRHDKLIILMMVDLNEFKQINDSLGHQAGDCVLQGFAQRVTDVIRSSDTACRYGGDEFAVMLPDIEKVQVWQQFGSVASKLHQALAAPFDLGSCTVNVTASIGGAIYPDDARCDVELIHKADSAMYEAKEAQFRAGLRQTGQQMASALRSR
jgi:diguanylate cyclase